MSTSTRLIVAAACSALLGCHSTPTAPSEYRSAALERVSAPASVVPGSAFSVTGYYGRGACDDARPVREQSATGARLGLRLAANVPPGTACIMILLIDSVRVEVGAPYTLPYTVRFERYMQPDSVVVITAR